MPGGGDYERFRRMFSNKSTSLVVLAATDDQTLITPKSANHQIFIQRIIVTITTYSAKTWLFKDSAGTPVDVAFLSIPAAAVALASESNNYGTFDFGAEGLPLTLGKNLLLDVSAAGAAGRVRVEAYEKLGATVAMDNTN